MVERYVLIITCIFLMGCAVTAKKYTIVEDGITKQVLEIDRGAEAKFDEHSYIKGEALIKVPEIPPIDFEYEK